MEGERERRRRERKGGAREVGREKYINREREGDMGGGGCESNLNIVCTATIVLQSARVSSSNEFELSLLTMTTLSARVIPAVNRSSRL